MEFEDALLSSLKLHHNVYGVRCTVQLKSDKLNNSEPETILYMEHMHIYVFAETKHNIGMGCEMYPPNTEPIHILYSSLHMDIFDVYCAYVWMVKLLRNCIADLILEYIYCKIYRSPKLLRELSLEINEHFGWMYSQTVNGGIREILSREIDLRSTRRGFSWVPPYIVS